MCDKRIFYKLTLINKSIIFFLFNEYKENNYKIVCNKGIRVIYINYIFYPSTFLFNQTKVFVIPPLFNPSNQTYMRKN